MADKTKKTKKTTASFEAVAERRASSCSDGCKGYVVFSVPGQHPCSSFSPVGMIPAEWGDGARVRVTFELLEDKPAPTGCINPWPSHKSICPERKKATPA